MREAKRRKDATGGGAKPHIETKENHTVHLIITAAWSDT
jgi:hypothetical protein